MSTAAWADEITVPTPKYFNDFSSTTGLTIVGNGVFEDDTDPRFGKIFHNDPTNTSALRTNYLILPTNVLSHSATSNEMTIGFWVNKKSENDFWFSPLFSAYGGAPSGEPLSNGTPMLVCETRGLIQLNCSGYCDFGINDATPGTTYNDGTPSVDTYWLDNGKWHYYTVVFTTTTAKVYIDGVLKNGWTVDGTSSGQVISGLFSNGSSLSYVCLGGNQAWTWGDADPAFGFDDFAVYDEALSAEQIAKIISDKNFDYTVVAKDGSSNTLKTIAAGTYTGTEITVAYPQYVLSGTTLYNIPNNSTDWFHTTFTPDADNYEKVLTYNGTSVSNVLFYVEGEDISGITQNTPSSTRTSCGKSGYTIHYNSGSESYLPVTTLPAGTYTIHTRCVAGKTATRTLKVKVGDEVKLNTTINNGTNILNNTEEFTIGTNAIVYVSLEGSSTDGLDWLYITGTPANNIIGAIDYTTGFMGAHKDFTISKGESIKLNFQNHGIGGTGNQFCNWLVRLSGTTGVNHTLRADNWVLGDDGGTVSTRSISQDGGDIDWPTFCEAMKDASVEMTITYTAEGMFSILVTATGNTHTFVHNFAYKAAKDGTINVELGVEKAWLEFLSADQLVTFGAIDWTTFVSTKNLDFSKAQAGLAAYVVTGNSGSAITKGEVTGIVPAGTPLLLSGTASTSFTVSLASSAGSAPVGNLLKAGDGSAVGYVADKTRYVLSKDDYDNPVFKKLAEGGYSAIVPSNKAYLEFDGDVSARELTFDFNSEETTGVADVRSKMADGISEYYDLQGRKITNPAKGLYIVNGKKVIIK